MTADQASKPTPGAAAPAGSDHKRWLALYVLCGGMLMIVLDATIVNVALPSIQDDLGFSSVAFSSSRVCPSSAATSLSPQSCAMVFNEP